MSRIEDGVGRRIEAVTIDPDLYGPLDAGRSAAGAAAPATFGAPAVDVLDISRPVATDAQQPLIAATATPWPGSLAVLRRTAGGDLTQI
ncbi:hypothetical protein J8J27_25420, partial [Mycobacterium tuberculosis]|nr:hypothetical protein [Mycobacterium tuberculosis]